MRQIGLCTSSRSERGLMEALSKEIKNSELYDIRLGVYLLHEYDFVIIPADRSEMARFALECFHQNIPFYHFLAGSQTFSYCHDDINRWLISIMANFCFAESPKARDNLIRFGVTLDRVIVTGTSHFDGITMQDIEANRPKDAPDGDYDLVLINPETQPKNEIESLWNKAHKLIKNHHVIWVKGNEDALTTGLLTDRPRLEFLWLLSHCDHFISNSSAIIYEVPYLNKFYGTKIRVINPSQRNSERTPIPPEYCRGASKIIADWCEKVNINAIRQPKHMFS